MGIFAANLFADYFLREIILVLVYSGVSKIHALSSICLLNKRAVYTIDWLNYFFTVQRSICDEDNREGKSIIYRGGFTINYIWLNSEINLSDRGFKWSVLGETVTKCPQTSPVTNARAQAQPDTPGFLTQMGECSHVPQTCVGCLLRSTGPGPRVRLGTRERKSLFA